MVSKTKSIHILGLFLSLLMVPVGFVIVSAADQVPSKSWGGTSNPPGNDQADSSTKQPSTTEPENQTHRSPLIGGGVHRPPDIGTAGTATPTPSVKTESPTDEPRIMPSETPMLPDPQGSQDSVQVPVAPLGQPDILTE